jgi:hypothetical protein
MIDKKLMSVALQRIYAQSKALKRKEQFRLNTEAAMKNHQTRKARLKEGTSNEVKIYDGKYLED